jgi:hypothetical protein
MLRRVDLVKTDVSEEPSTSFIPVTRIREPGTTPAVTRNRHTQGYFFAACVGCWLQLVLFLVHRFLSPWWRRRYFSRKCRFLQEPHGVTSQKTSFFNLTAFCNLSFYKMEKPRCLTIRWTCVARYTNSFAVLLFCGLWTEQGVRVALSPTGPGWNWIESSWVYCDNNSGTEETERKSQHTGSSIKQTPWYLFRKQTLPNESPPLVGEIYCQLLRIEGCRVVSVADPLWSLISVF